MQHLEPSAPAEQQINNTESNGLFRRAALKTAALAMSAAVLIPAYGEAQADDAEPTQTTATGQAVAGEAAYSYSFASSPDFSNADIGDVRKSPFWKPGDPNSTNKRYEKAFDTVLDAIKNEGVTDLAVAGDLVEGHWGKDTANTGIFGPVKTRDQKRQAVDRAAKLYYGQWADRIEDHGLQAYAALGDHEIGDNDWKGGNTAEIRAYNQFKQSTNPLWKKVFGKYVLQKNGKRLFPDHPKGPAADTAYATQLNSEVGLVSLDVFKQTSNDVIAQVDPQQMQWFKQKLETLNQEGVDWKVVQFHTPVVGPVRTKGSSGLMYEGGTNSELWKVMRQYGVNLVLNGEVHDITAHQPQAGDPVQISHGGLLAFGLSNYLKIDVSNDQMHLTSMDFHSKVGPRKKLWQTDAGKRQPAWVKYDPTPFVAGEMTVTQDGRILGRSGMLDVYKGKR